MALTGTIAITDFSWYESLSREASWEEVNFWTPSSYLTFRAPEFSPFLFKLKAPHNAICGFGFFVQYSALPDWLAWDSFGVANGCSSLNDMRARIGVIRDRMRYTGNSPLAQIGCIIVVGVRFLRRDDWIPQPTDWPVRTLRPTRYDLERGEGARVWNACLERVVAHPISSSRPTVVREEHERYGLPILVRPRLGQGAFRIAVTDAYGRACSVTGEHSLPVLEAAHIRPYAQLGDHDVCNGLLLRVDLHRLLDQGYVTVTKQHRLEVSSRLRLDYQNGQTYYPMHGKPVRVPTPRSAHPDPALLEWHNDHVFLV